MHEPHDPQDRMVHENLREIGRRLSLPTPTAQQQASWKSPRLTLLSTPDDPGLERTPQTKGLSVFARRFLTVAGSAAAALFAALAFILIPHTGSRVEAATILRSFRDAAHRGLRVQVTNLRIEGVDAAARIEVLFSQPVTLAQLAEDDDAARPESVYIDASVRLGPEADADLAGLEVQCAAAITPADKWAYLRLRDFPLGAFGDLPPEFLPMVRGFLRTASDGVMFDLNGVESLLENFADEDDAELRSLFGGRHAPANDRGAGVSADLHIRSDDEKTSVALDVSAAPRDASAEARLQHLVQSVLSGRAGRDELQTLIAELEQLNAHAAVTQESPGVWVLTADHFDLSGDAEAQALLGSAALVVRYQEGQGVLSAALEGIGSANGRIAFEFIDAIDASLLSRTRYLDRGVPTIDLRNPLSIFALIQPDYGDDQ